MRLSSVMLLATTMLAWSMLPRYLFLTVLKRFKLTKADSAIVELRYRMEVASKQTMVATCSAKLMLLLIAVV